MLTEDEATQILVWACQGPYREPASWVTTREFTPNWYNKRQEFKLEQIRPYNTNEQTKPK